MVGDLVDDSGSIGQQTRGKCLHLSRLDWQEKNNWHPSYLVEFERAGMKHRMIMMMLRLIPVTLLIQHCA